MTMRKFIRKNKEKLDKYIQQAAPGSPKNDDERERWVMNDTALYAWARSEGVPNMPLK